MPASFFKAPETGSATSLLHIQNYDRLQENIMNGESFENLWNFLGSWFPDSDLEGFDDDQVVRNFLATSNQMEINRVR